MISTVMKTGRFLVKYLYCSSMGRHGSSRNLCNIPFKFVLDLKLKLKNIIRVRRDVNEPFHNPLFRSI